MARPSVLMCDPFGIGLAIATRPRHLTWLERKFPGVDFDPSRAAWTADVLGTEGQDTYDVVVWVDRKRWRAPRSRAVVAAHEGAHVAHCMLDHIGEQQTSEVHAYLTDWAAGHIWDALNAPLDGRRHHGRHRRRTATPRRHPTPHGVLGSR